MPAAQNLNSCINFLLTVNESHEILFDIRLQVYQEIVYGMF
jgi:hypothetical protein